MYNKLFTKILDSSIWLENQPTRLVWITFIACMDQDGIVALSSVGNVANRARVTEQEAQEAIDCLESADMHNPDQDHEGRRIERIPGVGWFVLNSQKYRDIVKAETARVQNRERTRLWRERHGDGSVTERDANVTQGNEMVTPSEAEADSKKEKKRDTPHAAPTKGTRLADVFVLTSEMKDYAHLKRPTLDVELETEKFCNYWRGKSGRDATKLDWQATWRNWILNAREPQGGSVNETQYKSEREKSAERGENAITLVAELRRRGQEQKLGVSGGNGRNDTSIPFVGEPAESHGT